MQYNVLGRTDIQVSKICLGTMTRWYQNTEQEAHEQLDYALDQWVNFIDTAEIYAIPPTADTYGKTESYIGTWLKNRSDRDKIILATKVAGPGPTWIRNGEWFTPSGIEQAIEWSLQRLQTDYVDLYQLHRPQRPVQLRWKLDYPSNDYTTSNDEELIMSILKTCQKLQDSGKVRHFGLSNETPWGTMKFLELAKKHNLPRMQSIQNAYSIIRRDFEINLAEVSLQEDVSLLWYSPLGAGYLTGKYLDGKVPEQTRDSAWRATRMWYYWTEHSDIVLREYIDMATDLGISVTQLVLAFANDRKFMTSNIIWATTMAQLEEDISSAQVTLPQEVLTKIDELHSQYPNPGTF